MGVTLISSPLRDVAEDMVSVLVEAGFDAWLGVETVNGSVRWDDQPNERLVWQVVVAAKDSEEAGAVLSDRFDAPHPDDPFGGDEDREMAYPGDVWECTACGAPGEANFYVCWKCGADRPVPDADRVDGSASLDRSGGTTKEPE